MKKLSLNLSKNKNNNRIIPDYTNGLFSYNNKHEKYKTLFTQKIINKNKRKNIKY